MINWTQKVILKVCVNEMIDQKNNHKNSTKDQINLNKLVFGKAVKSNNKEGGKQFSFRRNHKGMNEINIGQKKLSGNKKVETIKSSMPNNNKNNEKGGLKLTHEQSYKMKIDTHSKETPTPSLESSERKMQVGFGKTISKYPLLEKELDFEKSVNFMYNFTPYQLAKEILKVVQDRNMKKFGRCDNMTLMIVFLHRGLQKTKD